MYADKFALDKYLIQKDILGKVRIYSEQKYPFFCASQPFMKKEILISDVKSLHSPILSVKWKLKKSLTTINYKYVITDRGHSPVGFLDCEKSPAFSINFVIKDTYNNNIGLVQPDQIGYVFGYISIIMQNKKVGIFYKNAHTRYSYILDLTEDRVKLLNRKLAVSLGVILASYNLPMQKFSGKVDWSQPVAVGDEIYKVKNKASFVSGQDDIYRTKGR